jgi:hypothetical protein
MHTATLKYGHEFHFTMFATLFIGCNALPEVDATIEGIPERITAFPTDAMFKDSPAPNTNERQATTVKADLLTAAVDSETDFAKAWLPEMHLIMIEHMRTVFAPNILRGGPNDTQLTDIPKCDEVQVMTNKVLAEGNPVLGFLMDPDCPFERVDEDTAMAPFYFFKEDWGNNAEWAAKYPFPAESKEFKKYMEKIPRGTSGIKIKYSERKIRSPLWGNRQERPYVGVRRKNQPSVVA